MATVNNTNGQRGEMERNYKDDGSSTGEQTGDNRKWIISTSLLLPLFLLACDPFYFVYSSSFMLKMNFVLLLYLKFNQGCRG